MRHEWMVTTTNGFSSTLPLYVYVLDEKKYEVKKVNEGDVILFIRKVFEKMQLATECLIISVIYLDKIMINGGIEIRYCNWRPLLFTAILTASKFWEDFNVWNIDYVESIGLYSLKSINRMESEFLSLCGFHLFVSAELYNQYYIAVKDVSNNIFSQQTHFNRFNKESVLTQSLRMSESRHFVDNALVRRTSLLYLQSHAGGKPEESKKVTSPKRGGVVVVKKIEEEEVMTNNTEYKINESEVVNTPKK